MLKILGCILVVASTYLIGMGFYKKMVSEKNFTQGCIDGLLYLMKEINFSLSYMEDGLVRASEYAGAAKALFLNSGNMMKDGKTTYQCWKVELDRLYETGIVSNKVFVLLDDLGKQLGKSDLENELKTLEGTVEKLKLCMQQQETQCNNKGKMYKKLGFLAGLVIVILLV